MNWVLLILAILADHVVTEVGIRRNGAEIEGNPLFRWSWRCLGGVASMVLQAAILLPLMWLAERFFPDEAILLPAILWLTVILNVAVLVIQDECPQWVESGRSRLRWGIAALGRKQNVGFHTEVARSRRDRPACSS